MKKINKFLSLVFITVFLIAIPAISAAVTITLNAPASSSTVRGITTFNTTVTGLDVTNGNLVNLTYYVKSASVNDTGWVKIGSNNSLNMTNQTVGNQTITKIDLTGRIEDANDYIFNVTILNDTASGFLDDVTNTGITVDQSAPSTPTILTPTDDSTDEDGTFVFNVSVAGANTTGCTLYFDGVGPGDSSYAMTHLGSACYYSATRIPEQTYNWYVTATDGTNTSTSSTWNIQVDYGVSTGRKALATDPSVATGTPLTIGLGRDVAGIPVWVIVIVVAGIVVAVLVGRNKKR